MMNKKYKIRNILVPVQNAPALAHYVAKAINLPPSAFHLREILKKSVDARNKKRLSFNYTLLIETNADLLLSNNVALFSPPKPYILPKIKLYDPNPMVIGAGPAGLFAAVELVSKGFAPYIFEQGDELTVRAEKVNRFWKTGKLDPDSNVQFGEGGAGAFSDGKLTSRNQDYYSNLVLENLVRFGASKSIFYEALPHLGTENIRNIVKAIRSFLVEKGCKFYYRHKLEDINVNQNRVQSVVINGSSYQPEALFLAIGNASRQIFSILHNQVTLAAKPFAVGFRIEHPQSFINQQIWGESSSLNLLGNASYRLTYQHKKRGVYSFCMCPGGFVIAGSSADNQIVTNGMSFHARNNIFANSAVVASIHPEELNGNALKGLLFQLSLEQKAFKKEVPFAAPVQSASDFADNRSDESCPASSYLPMTYPADFKQLFPPYLAHSLQKGLCHFDKKMPGFVANGVLIGPETRTSSPVRIVRDKELFFSVSAVNLFPIGEGSGYAGGIVSSAADGVKAASVIKDR